jgi:hypothetical protein
MAALGSWWVSRQMASAAKDSAAASQSSADASRRSATAAEESVDIQRREAAAAEEACQRAQLADVVPLYWDGRSGQVHRGLVIRNNGPAVARDIVAYEILQGSQMRKWNWPTLSADETRGLLENGQTVSDEEATRIGKPTDEGADSYARLEWTNADGSSGFADWRAIQHY